MERADSIDDFDNIESMKQAYYLHVVKQFLQLLPEDGCEKFIQNERDKRSDSLQKVLEEVVEQ